MSKLLELTKKAREERRTTSERPIKPKVGKNVYRILPPWNPESAEIWWRFYGQHFIKDANGQIKAVTVCLDRANAEPCPTCAAISQAKSQASDERILARLEEAECKQRYLVNVLERSGDNPNEPQVLEIGSVIWNEVADIMEEWGDISKIDTGRDIVVIRTGSGYSTEYSVTVAASSDPVPASVTEKLRDLDDFVMSQINEASTKRAINVISNTAGVALSAPSTVAALTHDDAKDADLYSEPAGIDTSAEAPSDVEAATSEEADVSEVSEDDLESMLNDL